MKGGAEHGSNVLSRLRSAPRTERGSLTSWYFALFALTPAICPQTRENALLLPLSPPFTFRENECAKVSLRGAVRACQNVKRRGPSSPHVDAWGLGRLKPI